MAQKYRITLSDGRKFDVESEGGPPSEADVMASLGLSRDETAPSMPFSRRGGMTDPAMQTPEIFKSTTNEKDAHGNAVVRDDEVDPNTLGTAVSHAWDQINPLNIGRAVMGATSHPIDTVKNIGAAQGALFDKAKASYDAGDYGTAARHFVDYLLPLVGPVLDTSSDEMQQGKTAAGIGDAVGLGLNLFGPQALSHTLPAAGQRFAQSNAGHAVADAADAAAERRVVNVIAPKVGANKVRFGNAAADVAGQVVRGTTGVTRAGIGDSVAANLEEARAGLDAAADARLTTRTFQTQPILKALQAKRLELTAEPVQGSRVGYQQITVGGKPASLWTTNQGPIGEPVVPGPNAARVAQIDQAIDEVTRLGPVAKYEPLRRIRESYDGPAKAVYNAAVSPDFLKSQGGAFGAADVAGALREHLAGFDPATAAANADFHLWKKASDVMTAADEIERVRPVVGRTLMAQGIGAMTGTVAGGGAGAVVGAMIGPTLQRITLSASPAVKIMVARRLADLADAVRAGDVSRIQRLVKTVQAMAPAGLVQKEIPNE